MTEQADNYKDVYANFGLAAYYAQCLEMELKNIFLLAIRANHEQLPPNFLDLCSETLDKQTLGTLVGDIRKVVSFSDDCVAAIETALSNRNRLMHGFFERHATDFLAYHGRLSMIQELEEYTWSFQTADCIARGVSSVLCKVLGITDEFLEGELAKMRQKATERPSHDT